MQLFSICMFVHFWRTFFLCFVCIFFSFSRSRCSKMVRLSNYIKQHIKAARHFQLNCYCQARLPLVFTLYWFVFRHFFFRSLCFVVRMCVCLLVTIALKWFEMPRIQREMKTGVNVRSRWQLFFFLLFSER